MTRIFDAHCGYILYQEIVQDQEKFEAVYRMACQVDAHNPYATSFKFRDFVNDYCSRNGMVDPDEEQTHNLRQHLIAKHDSNRDLSPPPPCRHPLIVGQRVFDDYCRYKLYEEIVEDYSKLKKWGSIAFEAVQNQDFFKFKELLETYCEQHNMVCLGDNQCRLLAKNLTYDVVSKTVPASEPLLVGTRVFDNDCLIQLCEEIATDEELYERMRKLAIRVVVSKDLTELDAYMNDYYKQNGMVCTNYGVDIEIIKLLRSTSSFNDKLFENKSGCNFRLLVHRDYYQHSRYVIFKRITQDPKLKDKCNRLYTLHSNDINNKKQTTTAVFRNFLEDYCRDNNIASPFDHSYAYDYFFRHINHRETFWSIQDWRLINFDGWLTLSLWWARYIKNSSYLKQKESSASSSSAVHGRQYNYSTLSNKKND